MPRLPNKNAAPLPPQEDWVQKAASTMPDDAYQEAMRAQEAKLRAMSASNQAPAVQASPAAQPAAAPEAAAPSTAPSAPLATSSQPPAVPADLTRPAPMSAQEIEARQKAERLAKKAGVVAKHLRTFLAAYEAGQQLEWAAAKANKGKKKKAKDKKPKPPAGRKKKPELPPRSKAWAELFAALDQLINKDKKVSVEDLHRGVGALEAREKLMLEAYINAITKKTFPLSEPANEQQVVIRQMIFSSVSAYEYRRDDAERIVQSLGPAALHARGVPVERCLELGVAESGLRNAGYSSRELVHGSGVLPALHKAGVRISELLLAHTPNLDGWQGVARLRQAGYSIGDLKAAGLSNAWDMKAAGYSFDEMRNAGYTAAELRMAGWGDTDAQPLSMMRQSVRPLQETSISDLPAYLIGTRDAESRRRLEESSRASPRDGDHARSGPGRMPPRREVSRLRAGAGHGPLSASTAKTAVEQGSPDSAHAKASASGQQAAAAAGRPPQPPPQASPPRDASKLSEVDGVRVASSPSKDAAAGGSDGEDDIEGAPQTGVKGTNTPPRPPRGSQQGTPSKLPAAGHDE